MWSGDLVADLGVLGKKVTHSDDEFAKDLGRELLLELKDFGADLLLDALQIKVNDSEVVLVVKIRLHIPVGLFEFLILVDVILLGDLDAVELLEHQLLG